MEAKLKTRKAGLFGAVVTNLSIMLMGTSMQASEGERTSAHEVTVCMESGNTWESGLAKVTARKMFADIGVAVKFCEKSKCPANREGIIQIRLNTGVPAERFPGALAYAMPYEGIHIEVFADRLRKLIDPKRMHNLLAHVLVHEITHMLQGVIRHSETGVMKAQWEHQDHLKMGFKPLDFTDHDILLIRLGLNARASRATNHSALEGIRAPEASGAE